MPSKSFQPKHLEKRHNTYYAVLTVPKDIQLVIGKKRFFQTTGTGDLRIATAKANLITLQWEAEIAEARLRSDDPVISSAQELNRLLKTSPRHLVEDVINEEVLRLRDESGDFVADTFEKIAKGKTKLLETYIPNWEKSQLKSLEPKTVAQMKRDLALLIDYIPSMNLISDQNCDAWIIALAKAHSFKSSSVTRIIGSCNNFYRYLQEISVIAESEISPFRVPRAYKKSKKRNAKSINKSNSWKAFSKSEIEDIHEQLLVKNDPELVDLVVIAAYTGARIEELCSLRIDRINLDERTITIEDAKSEAGNRVVPIHRKIHTRILKLMDESKNQYLFASLTTNSGFCASAFDFFFLLLRHFSRLSIR